MFKKAVEQIRLGLIIRVMLNIVRDCLLQNGQDQNSSDYSNESNKLMHFLFDSIDEDQKLVEFANRQEFMYKSILFIIN